MKVSVCMATFNGGDYVEEQLFSILEQLNATDEIIISDDGSTDNTVEVINKIDDNRIQLIFNSHKKGYTPNFLNALNHATGDIIFLSDQDDVWLPGKYNEVLETLKEYDLVITNSMVTDQFLNVTNKSFFTIYNSGKGIFKNIFCCTYYGCCMAFNKKVLNYSTPFPKNKEIAIDLWLGLIAEIIGKVKFLDTPYLLYRRTDKNVTQLGSILSRSSRPFYKKIYKRVVYLLALFKFSIRYTLRL